MIPTNEPDPKTGSDANDSANDISGPDESDMSNGSNESNPPEPDDDDDDDDEEAEEEETEAETDEDDEEDEDEYEDTEITVSPRIVYFSASDACVIPGSSVTLSWETENADQIYLGSTLVGASGTEIISPSEGETVTLTAINGERISSRNISFFHKDSYLGYQTIEQPFDVGDGAIDHLEASDDATLLTLSEGKIYKGSFESRFTRLNPNSSVASWQAIEIDPRNSSVLYAGTTGRIYRSANGGSSWPDVIPVRRNNADLELNTVYVSPADSNQVYIGFDGGAFVLNTRADTLELKSDLNTESIRRFAADAESVVAATRSGIFVSLNDGDSWNEKNVQDWGEIHSLDIYEGTLYISADEGLYHAETNALSNPAWVRVEGIDGPVYQALVRQEDRSSVIYAATDRGVYRDSGEGWEEVMTEQASWIVEDDRPIAVTESTLMSIEETLLYSDECSSQP